MYSTGLDNTFEDIGSGSVYPTYGPSIGALATGNAYPAVSDAVPMVAGPAAATGYTGNPVVGFAIFIVLVLLIMVVAHRFGGEEGEFRSIRGSFYNVLLIALVAATGIPAIKMAFSGLSSTGLPGAKEANGWVQAA
jgi:hypothetical protein